MKAQKVRTKHLVLGVILNLEFKVSAGAEALLGYNSSLSGLYTHDPTFPYNSSGIAQDTSSQYYYQ